MSLPIALTMGEPAGIGGEIALQAWLRRGTGVPPFLLVDHPERLRRLAARIKLDVPIAAAQPEEVAAIFPRALPVTPIDLAADPVPARPDPANASAVLAAIDHAVALVRAGRVGAVVTNPIHKASLYAAGFRHPGHTEYLAALVGDGSRPVMMLATPGLRVIPVTVHLPLARAIAALKSEDIVAAGRTAAASLIKDFGIARPRLAVAALNPHAGEDGAMGREEMEVIAPAVADLAASGIDCFGPVPADTLFHDAARRRYDAAVCMYHDQALIPLKTIDFDNGVNVTLGLPFVRTSPDHGTAFGIAGTGTANPASLIAALRLAAEMAARRRAARKG